MMRQALTYLLVVGMVLGSAPVWADDMALERLLRAHFFNKEFDGFNYYLLEIESDQPGDGGAREVTAVAKGEFLGQVQRVKALFLIVGDRVEGGQVLEKNGLPPCLSSAPKSGKSL
ncbi:MAG: hypothetical protein KGO52_14070 [Nitrospirota bacterium]|nr:hypothetical protein [Nitrospirota bacterium]MDE3243837.1 hypothetical protein [Nitrospirota bacterium]